MTGLASEAKVFDAMEVARGLRPHALFTGAAS